jgi:hypothetical protein
VTSEGSVVIPAFPSSAAPTVPCVGPLSSSPPRGARVLRRDEGLISPSIGSVYARRQGPEYAGAARVGLTSGVACVLEGIHHDVGTGAGSTL